MKKDLKLQIESLLLVATKPLKLSKIKELVGDVKMSEIHQAVLELKDKFNKPDSGVRIVDTNDVIQFTTASEATDLVKFFVKDETTGELTRPSLETLTIIAYRQPITKAELEQIRGVNCSMILRNLMIRGLITKKDNKKMLASYYFVTTELLKFLGITEVSELPDYERLNNNEHLKKLLDPNGDQDDDKDMDNFISDDEIDITSDKEDSISKDTSKKEPEDDSVRLTVNVYS